MSNLNQILSERSESKETQSILKDKASDQKVKRNKVYLKTPI